MREIEMKKIMERKEYLENVIASLESKVQTMPPGKIKANKHKNGWQYYYRQEGNEKNGVYMKKEKLGEVQKYIQAEYEQAINIKAHKELHILKQLITVYEKGIVENYINQIPEGKRILIEAIEKTDEQFSAEWSMAQYDGKDFDHCTTSFYTDKGERVRSKSEVLIANLLYKRNIPYHYEKPLYLKRLGTVYPDFTILDVRKRKEIIWEHFGMMDDYSYSEKAYSKINYYEQNDFYLGRQLLVTFESKQNPINIAQIEKKMNAILE